MLTVGLGSRFGQEASLSQILEVHSLCPGVVSTWCSHRTRNTEAPFDPPTHVSNKVYPAEHLACRAAGAQRGL